MSSGSITEECFFWKTWESHIYAVTIRNKGSRSHSLCGRTDSGFLSCPYTVNQITAIPFEMFHYPDSPEHLHTSPSPSFSSKKPWHSAQMEAKMTTPFLNAVECYKSSLLSALQLVFCSSLIEVKSDSGEIILHITVLTKLCSHKTSSWKGDTNSYFMTITAELNEVRYGVEHSKNSIHNSSKSYQE